MSHDELRRKWLSFVARLERLADRGALKVLKTVALHLLFLIGVAGIVYGWSMMHVPTSIMFGSLTLCLLVVAERRDMLSKERKHK